MGARVDFGLFGGVCEADRTLFSDFIFGKTHYKLFIIRGYLIERHLLSDCLYKYHLSSSCSFTSNKNLFIYDKRIFSENAAFLDFVYLSLIA